VGYEIYLLPVPAGGDVEETAEALLARLERATEVPGGTADAVPAALIAALRAADPTLGPAPLRVPAAARGPTVPVLDLRTGSGIELTVARGFVRFLVPFEHRGEDAEAVFDRLFRLLAASSSATGWLGYDPQQASAATADDGGRDGALEIYLSVMDQIRPAGPGPAGARTTR
jgi:hypothetical protein